MLAAHFASEVASRLVKPTASNYQVTDAVQKVADSFGCKPIEGEWRKPSMHVLSRSVLNVKAVTI